MYVVITKMRSLVMRCFSFCKNGDVESQGSKKDGTIISKTLAKYWDVAFLVVCIVAIAVEPIFFYLPVIKEATKCIAIDPTLKIIGICVRSFLDLIALGDLIARKKKYIESHDMKCSDYVINILSILPVPQVIVPIIFSDMRDYKSRHGRKVLNAVVLLQYVPRIFRIYRLWKIVNETIVKKNIAESDKKILKRFIVMKAGLNLLLYLVASNVLGAFWYFVSIQRETTCWQLACKNDIGCSKTSPSFNCGDGFGNYTFLNDSCSVETPKTTLFDFGIFQKARQSGILASKDFFQKTMYCFWWGLRNLSSLGQNLETSSDYWENCFTVLISIFGLLLFLFFIGNLQAYMQWETSNELDEIKSKRLKNKEEKLSTIKDWISTLRLPDELKQMVMDYVTPKLEDQKNDFDAENPFPHLSEEIRKQIKIKLCSPLLQKVPKFQNESEELLSKHLEHVQYNQNDFIVREKHRLDAMIFVVGGIVCTCTSNHDDKTDQSPDKCEIIGENLVQWVLESSKQSNPPSSEKNFKCLTKVEAFRLTARDLNDIFHPHPSKECGGDSTTPSIPYFKKIPSLLCSHCRPASGSPNDLDHGII